MKKKLLIAVILTIFALVAAACGNSDSKDKDDKSSSGSKSEESKEVTIQHELGKTKVKQNPKKVVVFDFGALDTLDKLGVDVAGVPQKVVPPYLKKYEDKKYENVGSLKEPDFEKLANMDPDLILISARQADLYKQFEEIAPTVYVGTDTNDYLGSFKKNMKTIGEIFGKEDEVNQQLKDIDSKVADVKEKAEKSKKNGLVILANDSKISAYGPKSRYGFVHDVLGVKPADNKIEASTHGMNISFEYIKEKNPDILYVVDRSTAIGEGKPAKDFLENDLVKQTNAYKDGKIIYLDPYMWYLSGGGLESVNSQIDDIAKSLD
ncbi:siderophore ABC transporter substrate-binding protein [Aciduricibacillus chroicocephali]|uniref:Siderophore ABC transporter substrate-binding protein n=1 Tax=Aciduricibacillus chroicocephali TaxID=3054939 RepID=A0ABY9KW38_9BACI|nr:siderophore ABC transporter substrate-binding protein [Bacillaceae bacterium 44XB]